VLAVFLPVSGAVGAIDPCHRKNPTTSAGIAHSRIVLQEDFINWQPRDTATTVKIDRYLVWDFPYGLYDAISLKLEAWVKGRYFYGFSTK
jgi:hypothetical protein